MVEKFFKRANASPSCSAEKNSNRLDSNHDRLPEGQDAEP